MQITKSSLEDGARTGRLVHGHRLHRYRRRAVRALAPGGGERPLRPGARTAWHRHPNGQTVFVTEGVGLCQRRGGAIETIRPGDRAFFEPGEEHWHGAAADRFMIHLAMHQVDEQGSAVTWGEHVSDEEYGATRA